MDSRDKSDASPQQDREKLFDEFSPASYAQWRAEVDRILKGASFENRMQTKTFEDITLAPIYNNEDTSQIHFQESPPGFSPFARGSGAFRQKGHAWEIAQEINYPDLEEFNEAILNDIQNGLTAVILPLDIAGRLGFDPDRAHWGDTGYEGVSISSLTGMADAFKGIDLAAIPVYIQCGISGLAYLGLYAALAKKNRVPSQKLRGAVCMDPLGELILRGEIPETAEKLYDEMAEMTSWASRNAPGLGTIWIHGEIFSNAGGNAVQEMAFAIAIGVEYLRAMQARGLEPDRAVPHFRFSFGQGSNFFMEASKLRAARLLWNRVLEECELPESLRRIHIHARTSNYTKTIYDPYVNVLRGTIETLSGIIGGADSLYSAPYDEHIRPSDGFSRRLARNIQLILKDETHLDRILDPAGGSCFVEKLTSEIAERSWKLFQEIESLGGMYRSLLEAFPQSKISATAIERARAYVVRDNIMVGTNKYPNPSEERLAPRPFDYHAFHEKRTQQMEALHASSDERGMGAGAGNLERILEARNGAVIDSVIDTIEKGATTGEIIRAIRMGRKTSVSIAPIPQIRGAEPFEKLRTMVERQMASRPDLKVYVATIGPAAEYMPRLDFSAQFFEIGGFKVIRTMGHETPQEAADDAIDENTLIIVICGKDDSYPENVPLIASQIKKENPRAVIILAGNPKSETLKTRYLEAGVDIFIHLKSNVLETLTDLASRLGVI